MSVFSETSKRTHSTDPLINCVGKVGFDTYAQAKAVLNRPQIKSRPGRSSYHCGHCHKWHLGTDKGHVEKKRAANFKERKKHD